MTSWSLGRVIRITSLHYIYHLGVEERYLVVHCLISGAKVMKTTDIVCSTNGWKTRAVQGFSRLSRFPRASILEVRFQLRNRQQPEPEQRTTLLSQSLNPPINSNNVVP
ncbi:hypothetical protein RRG08_007850 [Elysia crispata]|uniref:Uncharacterized protein n=1 Tax=Elysia crispata TaxID=231223 RepID=A0AAE0XWW5_9GAST|nr:hypothetical protein RRG08_007850 [Elysia crispata]